MVQIVSIHKIKSKLSSTLLGNFQSRRLFHVSFKSGQAIKRKQTMDPRDF